MSSYKITDTMCGRCPSFEPNGTPFGGKCTSPEGQWRGITISCLMDEQPCHPNARAAEALAHRLAKDPTDV